MKKVLLRKTQLTKSWNAFPLNTTALFVGTVSRIMTYGDSLICRCFAVWTHLLPTLLLEAGGFWLAPLTWSLSCAESCYEDGHQFCTLLCISTVRILVFDLGTRGENFVEITLEIVLLDYKLEGFVENY